MKNRVIFGILFGLVGIALVIFPFSPLPDVVVFILTLMAVFELEKSVGVKNKFVHIVSLLFSALTLGYHGYSGMIGFDIPILPIVITYCIIMLVTIVADFGKTKFEHAGMAILFSLIMPTATGCFLRMRNMLDIYDNLTRGHIRFLVWFCLAGAVFADTFALFAGIKLGKHKLCPRVSPKKTVEGAVGGVIGSAVINIIALFVCNWLCYNPFPLPVWFMIILSFVVPVVSMFGDLIASTIKRNYGIKDFGNLIPGHGGIMDRLDSISIVAPFIYCVLLFSLKLFS
ncbi:MAG: CDP-archaeol synthase [Clostridia bacterium]|nr:CDP-archaeol synthase [Clostridia bacterium]